MTSSSRYANSLTPVPTGCLHTLRTAWRRWRLRPQPRRAAVSPARVAALAAAVQSEPALHMWMRALEGKAPAVQRALLARGCEVFRQAAPPVREVLSQMTRRELREPVLAALAARSAPPRRATPTPRETAAA